MQVKLVLLKKKSWITNNGNKNLKNIIHGFKNYHTHRDISGLNARQLHYSLKLHKS